MPELKTMRMWASTHTVVVRLANEIGRREDRKVDFVEVVDIAVRALGERMKGEGDDRS